MHKRRYAASDSGGSVRFSGRYNRGSDRFSVDDTWSALYLALGPEVCLGEVLRHISSEARLRELNDYRLSELSLELDALLDCRVTSPMGLSLDDVLHDTDYSVAQELAAAAIAQGMEGMLIPSASRLGDNLVLFPSQLRPGSRINVVGSRDPRLYVSHG